LTIETRRAALALPAASVSSRQSRKPDGMRG
jgi:hypothetical protein